MSSEYCPIRGHSDRPLADVARIVMGHGGAALVAVGALVSVYGYLSANILAIPRMTFALAERGDFPSLVRSGPSQIPHAVFLDSDFCAAGVAAGACSAASPETQRSRPWRGLSTTVWCAPRFRCCGKKQPNAKGFRLPGGRSSLWLAYCFVSAF